MGEQTKVPNCILLTGYGPFGVIVKNPSSEIVRQVASKWKPKEHHDVELVTYDEIPVCYDYISSNITEWWQKHQPMLTVHIGVWKNAPSVFLECRSFNDRYSSVDVSGNSPPNGVCRSADAPQILQTTFDVNALSECLNRERIRDAKPSAHPVGHNSNKSTNDSTNGEKVVQVAVNNDPGRFLCGYIYYSSLYTDMERRRVLFVHVPDADNPWSVEAMAAAVYRLLELLLQSACSNCKAPIATCHCSHRQPVFKAVEKKSS